MIVFGKDKLRVSCEKVASPEEALKIAEELSTELSKSTELGIGLAANQIGLDKQVFILRLPQTDSQGFKHHIQITFANPVITNLKSPVRIVGEGCLSFPGEKTETLRYSECTVTDLFHPEGMALKGLRAVAAQHEADHLMGVTMHDRLFSKVRPTHICRCGSGKEFGKCCMKSVAEFSL